MITGLSLAKRLGVALTLWFLLGLLVIPLGAQSGPYSAQIQRALRALGISGTPTHLLVGPAEGVLTSVGTLGINAGTNSLGLVLENSKSGTNNTNSILLYNSVGLTETVVLQGMGNGGDGVDMFGTPYSGILSAAGTGGLVLAASNATGSIDFTAGGYAFTNRKLRVSPTQVLVGSTAGVLTSTGLFAVNAGTSPYTAVLESANATNGGGSVFYLYNSSGATSITAFTTTNDQGDGTVLAKIASALFVQTGTGNTGGMIFEAGHATGPIRFAVGGDALTNEMFRVAANSVFLNSSATFAWASTTSMGAIDTVFKRAAANAVTLTSDGSTTNTADLGTSAVRLRSGYFGTSVVSGGTVTAFGLTPNGSLGTPVTVAGPSTRKAAVTSAQTLATFTVGAADGSFDVSANILVTTATTHTFTVTCAYTDEGNTARTLTMPFTLVAGTAIVNSVANGNGAVPYMGIVQHIRAKAATTITIATVGTFTTVTYNGEGLITQKG